MMKTKITFLPKYTYFVLCFIYKKMISSNLQFIGKILTLKPTPCGSWRALASMAQA